MTSIFIVAILCVVISYLDPLMLSSLMVLPGSLSLKMCKNIKHVYITSVLISFLSVLSGIIISYNYNINLGITVSMLLIVIYLSEMTLKFLYTQYKNLLNIK
jgi:zinc transport system permease protein